MHQTDNVLDKLPEDMRSQAKQCLQQIWMAPSRQRAEIAFNFFIAAYEQK
jgi:putative transposase